MTRIRFLKIPAKVLRKGRMVVLFDTNPNFLLSEKFCIISVRMRVKIKLHFLPGLFFNYRYEQLTSLFAFRTTAKRTITLFCQCLQLSHGNIVCFGARPQISTGQGLQGYALISQLLLSSLTEWDLFFLTHTKKTAGCYIRLRRECPLKLANPALRPCVYTSKWHKKILQCKISSFTVVSNEQLWQNLTNLVTSSIISKCFFRLLI